MAKKKKTKIPDAKKNVEARPNPFELHFNKVKRNAVGRRVMKGEVGRPTKSRNEGLKKRNQTLLKEYVNQGKSGKGVVDLRLKDCEGGFAARKARVFELKMREADGESLTHRGKAITAESAVERPDSDDDEDLNLLSRPDYIESAHFGGGDADSLPFRTQEDFLKEMIEEKHKRQLEKEADYVLTEKLDGDFQGIRSLVWNKGPKKDSDKEEPSSYDILLKELMYNTSSAPSKKTQQPPESESKPEEKIEKKKPEKKVPKSLIEKLEESRKIPEPKMKDFVILPMIEPRIESSLRKKRQPIKKLQKKVKREFKGAQRELRKDNRFIRDVELKQMKADDAERKRKVNRILADLASDLHNYKKATK